MRKVILDCDPGHDDAFAIMLAAGNLDLLGVTTVDLSVGDLTGDGQIDVSDVTTVIAIVLNG